LSEHDTSEQHITSIWRLKSKAGGKLSWTHLALCFCWCLAWLILWLWNGSDMFLWNAGLPPKYMAWFQTQNDYFSIWKVLGSDSLIILKHLKLLQLFEIKTIIGAFISVQVGNQFCIHSVCELQWNSIKIKEDVLIHRTQSLILCLNIQFININNQAISKRCVMISKIFHQTVGCWPLLWHANITFWICSSFPS
jgi:hypothetical protein